MDTLPTTAYKRCEFYIHKLEEIEPPVTAAIGSSAQIKTYIHLMATNVTNILLRWAMVGEQTAHEIHMIHNTIDVVVSGLQSISSQLFELSI